MSSVERGNARVARALFGLFLAACGGEEPATTSEPSYICESLQAPTECPQPPPTFAQVAPIIGERCATPCHSGTPNGPWPLARYEHIYDWQEDIRSRLLECTMPPLDGGVPITTDERRAILVWIRCGLPE